MIWAPRCLVVIIQLNFDDDEDEYNEFENENYDNRDQRYLTTETVPQVLARNQSTHGAPCIEARVIILSPRMMLTMRMRMKIPDNRDGAPGVGEEPVRLFAQVDVHHVERHLSCCEH